MSDEIKPALTAEEWGRVFGPRGDADFIIRRGQDEPYGRVEFWTHTAFNVEDQTGPTNEIGIRDIPPDDVGGTSVVAVRGRVSQVVAIAGPEQLHTVAALALHGNPFGFTWEMVDALRSLLADAAAWHSGFDSSDEIREIINSSFRLADTAVDNIAALLPPREAKA
jgi:hypothetical protein